MVSMAEVLRVLDRIHGREPPPPSQGYGTSRYRWFENLVLELAEATLEPEELDRLYKAMTGERQ
ncbi:MAG: hypothetical protein GXO43_09870 [Crenarchaeota archaeon]|nr:hypothetical protein [Thermoproteota archaeon]